MEPWAVTVTPKPPKRPKLVAPAKKSYTNDVTPVLSWEAVTDGDTYQVQVDDDRRFRSPEETVVSVLEHMTGGLADGKYYWRVRAINSVGVPGPWSAKWFFTVDTIPPDTPLLNRPTDGSEQTTLRPTLRWYKSAGAHQYELQLDTDPLFPLSVVEAGRRRYYKPPTPLNASIYYWRVRAVDKAGNRSAWSAAFAFTIPASDASLPDVSPAATPEPPLLEPATPKPEPPVQWIVPTQVPPPGKDVNEPTPEPSDEKPGSDQDDAPPVRN
jgi:hypothetical protein